MFSRTRMPSAATALLGLAAALLISCSSSGKGLIPAGAAGPLESDFEAVQQTAETANGDWTGIGCRPRLTREIGAIREDSHASMGG